jgi:ubiquinone/menaquinone biosynthesis C-methylase UbiE
MRSAERVAMPNILVGLGHKVRGTDLTAGMLKVAEAKVPDARFDVAPLDALPLSDESCDVAVCALALTHEPDIRPAIHELARVIRAGGHLVISDVYPFMVGLGADAFYTSESGASGTVRNYLHLPSAYLSSFRDAGFAVEKCVEPLCPKEAAMLPWFKDQPELCEPALAGLPVVIVWELTKI